MTDKFEEWLLSVIKKYPAKTLDECQEQDEHFERGLNIAYSEALTKYREFLKEQSEKAAPYDITKFYPKPKESPLIFWGGIYYKWDETKKRFIPQFAARLK